MYYIQRNVILVIKNTFLTMNQSKQFLKTLICRLLVTNCGTVYLI